MLTVSVCGMTPANNSKFQILKIGSFVGTCFGRKFTDQVNVPEYNCNRPVGYSDLPVNVCVSVGRLTALQVDCEFYVSAL